MVQAPFEAKVRTRGVQRRGPSATHAARLHHAIHKQRPPGKIPEGHVYTLAEEPGSYTATARRFSSSAARS